MKQIESKINIKAIRADVRFQTNYLIVKATIVNTFYNINVSNGNYHPAPLGLVHSRHSHSVIFG